MLMSIPEVAEMFRVKVEALSGEDFKKTIDRVVDLFETLKHTGLDSSKQPEPILPSNTPTS
jgi:hypothetical protein